MNVFTKATDWNRNVVRHSHFLHIGKEFVVTAVLCNQVHNWLMLVTVATPRVVYGRQSHLLLVCYFVYLFVCFFQTRFKDSPKQYCVNIMLSIAHFIVRKYQ